MITVKIRRAQLKHAIELLREAKIIISVTVEAERVLAYKEGKRIVTDLEDALGSCDDVIVACSLRMEDQLGE